MSPWLYYPLAGALLNVALMPIVVGKPRKPVTGGSAVVTVIFSLVSVTCLLKAGGIL